MSAATKRRAPVLDFPGTTRAKIAERAAAAPKTFDAEKFAELLTLAIVDAGGLADDEGVTDVLLGWIGSNILDSVQLEIAIRDAVKRAMRR